MNVASSCYHKREIKDLCGMYSSMMWYLAWFFNNWKIDPAILHCWWPHFWGISTKLKHSWVIPTMSGFNFFCRSSSFKLKSNKTGWNNLPLQNLTQEMNHYPEWYLTLDGRYWGRDRKKRFVGATAAFWKLNWKEATSWLIAEQGMDPRPCWWASCILSLPPSKNWFNVNYGWRFPSLSATLGPLELHFSFDLEVIKHYGPVIDAF